ncbi:MAG TPA: aldo/keto reductase [Longimicrobiales bacterium]|nr:aldo/keto reductase [Longimicrobiales bacterium]
MQLCRRDVLKMGIGAGAALALGRRVLDAAPGLTQEAQLMKAIPSSGERIPAVGLGTASTFSGAARSPEEHAALREVLRLFTDLGGSVIDTSPSYGRGASEETLGELMRNIGNAGEIFMATKISGAGGRDEGMAQFDRSLELMSPVTIDLEQVHNLGDWQTQLPLLRELKQEGRIRYVGITTSSDRQYEDLARILRTEELDFVQFDYAVDNRNAEEELIPIARDRGFATLVNGPFGRTRLFSRAGDREVPEWAHEFGATTWARFFLKWLLGNDAITVVIPATSDPDHLRDNMGAGLGRLPNEDERRRMAAFVDALPPAPRRGRGGRGGGRR